MDDYDEEVLQFLNEMNYNNNILAQTIEAMFAFQETMPTKRKYTVHERIDPFVKYDETEFERRYRLTKAQVQQLYHYVDGQRTLEPIYVRDNFTIPGILKLLIALRFYAVGCFSEALADLFGVSKSTASNLVGEVSFIICHKLKQRFIRMPSNQNELIDAKVLFHRLGNFPLTIGAVDGTHIKVQSIGGEFAELYRNRKGFFSINCQIMTSADVI